MNIDTWVLAPVRLSAAADEAITDRHGLVTVRPSTITWLRGAMRQLIQYTGDINVEELTPVRVAAWLEWQRERVKPVTANTRLRAIRTVYSRLQKKGVVSSNPAAPVRYLAEAPLAPGAVSEADYLAMRDVAGGSRNRALLDVLWASGCRLGGLLSMRVDRMDRWEENGQPAFALQVTEKYDKTRWVYVGRDQLQSDGLAEWLTERPATSSPWLWLAFTMPLGWDGPATELPPRGPLAESSVQGILRRCRIRAGIPTSRPTNAHAFRHAWVIRMLDEGIDLSAVSNMAGHSKPAFTAEVYVRRSEQQLRMKYFRRN